jgi:hypothetical protein
MARPGGFESSKLNISRALAVHYAKSATLDRWQKKDSSTETATASICWPGSP